MKVNKLTIVVLAYKRCESLKRLMNSLTASLNSYCIDVDLLVSIDYSETQDQTLAVINNVTWPYGEKRTVIRESKLGLKRNVLESCSSIDNGEGFIVLEDDIEVSKYFIDYTYEVMSKYGDDDMNICGFSLYSYKQNVWSMQPFHPKYAESDVYLMQVPQSWGQAYTLNMWKKFAGWYQSNTTFKTCSKLPERLSYWGSNSWLKHMFQYISETDSYFVYPYKSYSTNHTEAGTHSVIANSYFETNLAQNNNLRLYDIEKLIKYDTFYERIDLTFHTKAMKYSNICLDLYGLKSNYESYQFVISSKRLKYKAISSFGCMYIPHEDNITNEVNGDVFTLYDLNITINREVRSSLNKITDYDMSGYSIKRLFYYTIWKIVRIVFSGKKH